MLPFLFLFLVAPAHAGRSALTIELGRVSQAALTLDGVRVQLGVGASVSIDALTVGERTWRALRLDCPDFELAAGRLRCRGGRIVLPGVTSGASVDLAYEATRSAVRIELADDAGGAIAFEAAAGQPARFVLKRFPVARLVEAAPALAPLQPAGTFDGIGTYRPHRNGAEVGIEGSLEGGQFGSSDGLQAGEGLSLAVNATASRVGDAWDWQGQFRWFAGAAYLHPLYFNAGPSVAAQGRWRDGILSIARADARIDGVESLAASAEIDLAAGKLRRAALSLARADLAVIGPQFVAPLIAPAQADRWRFAGHVSAGIEYDGNAPIRADFAFDEAGVSVADGRLSFGPVSGRVPWDADAETRAQLHVAGGRWERLELGAFDVAADVHGRSVDVSRVEIPMLDGRLIFEKLALRRGATGWFGGGSVVVEPLSMGQLTEALGWPAMSGRLAASLPGLRIAPGEIALDGALVVSIFDGYVQATRLQVLEPFGLASRLFADIEARHIDLGELTETFSFGSVTGYVDADIAGLELARWRPVRFDARVASSPGDYSRRISQRAVQNIGALGGVGAAVAIQRSFLRFFETFGYRQIGLSCALRGHVCRMGGISGEHADGGGFPIVRGGGVPALNVIGYNRRVDWQELVSRLQRVIASNVAPRVR